MKKLSLYALVLCFGISLFLGIIRSAFGSVLTSEDILENLKSTFSKIKDYEVSISVETDIKQIRIPKTKARIYFRQPDKTHVEAFGFAMLPRDGIVLNPNRFNEDDFYISILEDELSKDSTIVKIVLMPRKEGIKFRRLVLDIDPKRWVISKISTVSWNGQSIDINFQYKLFKDEFWMPVEAVAIVDLSGFRGFSGFHDDPRRQEDSKGEAEQQKGKITILFYDYKINEGIPDSVFETPEEEIVW